MAGRHLIPFPSACSLHMNSPPSGGARRAGPALRLVSALVEQLGRVSFSGRRTAPASRWTILDTSESGSFMSPTINRLGRTDDDARRLEADVQSMRAEVALLRRVILGIDEDRIVRARGDARLASDARRLVEVDDAVGPAVHRGGRASGDAGCILALIAASYLKGAARAADSAPRRRT